jgi:hypothetical protein
MSSVILTNNCFICHVMHNENKGGGGTKTFKALLQVYYHSDLPVCKMCIPTHSEDSNGN